MTVVEIISYFKCKVIVGNKKAFEINPEGFEYIIK